MANYENEINSWPVLKNGLHYKWLVDYAAFSAFGTFELTAEEWEKRDLIVNFKGNSELTTEMDHQEALKKAIEMVSDELKTLLGEEAAQFTLVCIPAALEAHTKRRFKEFSEEVCKATGMTNAYPAFSYTHDVDEDGDPVDELHINEALCGITEEELYSVFDEQIKAMAARYKVSEDEMKYRLKRKYDGYHFSPSMLDIYNPFSILNSLSKKILSDFWFRTGSPTYLVRLLAHFDENLNELTGKFYPTSSFIDYKADTEAPLPMIYQSGYLTIKDWNMDTDSYLLDFPNDEVKAGFVTMVAANYLKPKESPDAWVVEVVNTMKMGDCDKLEKLLTSFFASIPYSQRRKDDEREKERYFQYTFYLVIRMISSFTVLIEKEQSEGRVDCIIETPMFVYIFEFKRDGSAPEALKQIEEKGYAREYATDNRTIYLIGCNFSSKTGTIDDWKSKGKSV